MKLPGKLTERHIKAHVDMGNTYFFYKNIRYNAAKLWRQICEEKKASKKEEVKNAKSESRDKHRKFSDESKEDTGL